MKRSNGGHGHARNTHAALLRSGPRVVPAVEPWMQHSACLDVNPELFYPGPGEYDKHRAAKRICDGCPVRTDCLLHALKTHEAFGIWGGLSHAQRRKVSA